jgi:predicted nucleic acid-binding protein
LRTTVLLAAKKRGLIESVQPMLEAFAGNGYHFSDALAREILMRAGER